MADAIDMAVRAQGGGVVTPNQVKAMILAARRAYKAQSELGLVDDGVDFDAWRKATLHDVTGGDAPESFRTVTQRDYAAVMEYFGKLGGDDGSGLHSLALTPPAQNATASLSQPSLTPPAQKATASPSRQTRSADAQRRALWALNLVEGEVAGTLGGRGGARRYADALFWKIHRTERSLATPRQIWAVIFTLRNRARKFESVKVSKCESCGSPRTARPTQLSSTQTFKPSEPREKGRRNARSGGGIRHAPGQLRAFSRVFPRLVGDCGKGAVPRWTQSRCRWSFSGVKS